MSEQVISAEAIKKQARRAAESGKPVDACQYMPGSDAEKAWKAAYWAKQIDLSGEATA